VEAAILLVPTLDGWTIPALLSWTAGNGCPEPSKVSELLRAWGEIWGAELCALTHNALEVRVTRPPVSVDDAALLLEQHKAFCPDLFADTEVSAAELVRTTNWIFWWR
jgi:hypothetical protein